MLTVPHEWIHEFYPRSVHKLNDEGTDNDDNGSQEVTQHVQEDAVHIHLTGL